MGTKRPLAAMSIPIEGIKCFCTFGHCPAMTLWLCLSSSHQKHPATLHHCRANTTFLLCATPHPTMFALTSQQLTRVNVCNPCMPSRRSTMSRSVKVDNAVWSKPFSKVVPEPATTYGLCTADSVMVSSVSRRNPVSMTQSRNRSRIRYDLTYV